MHKPAKEPYAELMAGDVRDYLLAHPDFLGNNADLLNILVPPTQQLDDGVSDFQRFQITHLQEDAGHSRAQLDRLEKLLEDNLRRERRLHGATLGLLEAQNFKDMVAVVEKDFPLLLDHEAAVIVIEKGGTFLNGARLVPEGFVREWLPGREIACESDRGDLLDIFGARAAKVRGSALVRLSIDSDMPAGLLALGHRDPMYYASGTATEQVLHLASVVEFCIRKWLRLP